MEKRIFFHSNGVLKTEEYVICNSIAIGIWREFDEKGYLKKEIDEDEKFDKVKPDDILRFMEKEGLINLETGKGRFDSEGREAFRLNFAIVDKNPKWVIEHYTLVYPNSYKTLYVIDGHTGEVISKEKIEVVKKR